MKKVIYTQRVDIIDSYSERRDSADQRIPEFIWYCGGLPIPIPNNSTFVNEFVEQISPSVIVLVGGNSLAKYGGNAPERDSIDHHLIQIAVDKHIPLYGFCRGMQSILDFFGNSLVSVSNHVATYHTINGKNDSFEVNSYHNQGCLNLSNNQLRVVMISTDGVIEKIQHCFLPIVGTMWHPEREFPFRDFDVIQMKTLLEY